jgi:AcrR family transcriptional regulator
MGLRDYEQFLRKAPKQSRSRAVVDAIVQAARESMKTKGASGMVMEAVALRAGVAIGSLYDYFEDRDGLVQALTSKVTAENFEQFRAVLSQHAESSLDELALALADHVFDTYLNEGATMRAIVTAAYALQMMPLLARTQHEFCIILAEALAKRSDVRADPKVAAFLIVHGMMGVVHSMLWLESGAPERAVLRDAVRAQAVLYLRCELREGR